LDKKKVLRRSGSLAGAASDLIDEAKFLIRCRGHPYIVQLRGLSKQERGAMWINKEKCIESFFLMMDELDDTLDNRIVQWRRQKKSSADGLAELVQKTNYALQVASALKFLHKHRLVYRDLKPENIGFVSNGQGTGQPHELNDKIQLFDFGLCRELPETPTYEKDLSFDKTLCLTEKYFGACENKDGNKGMYALPDVSGSPRYMAGEVVLTKGLYNLKSDVYSWAITFYEMLSLSPAFEKYDYDCLKEDVWKQGQRPSFSKTKRLQVVPKSIVRLLRKSWSKYPLKRPTSAECCQELERILVQLQALDTIESETLEL